MNNPRLYKFLANRQHEFTDTPLVHNEIYLSMPHELNDPEDCDPVIQVPKSLEAARALVETIEKISGLTTTAFPDSDLLSAEFWGELFREIRSKWGIFSLSANSEESYMWNKYADKSQGLAVEFDTCEWKELPSRPRRVNYLAKNAERPSIDITDLGITGNQITKDTFLTKAYRWTREKEWRFVDVHRHGKVPINPQDIVGVTLGCNLNVAESKRIAMILADRESVPVLRRARAHDSRVEHVPITYSELSSLVGPSKASRFPCASQSSVV